MSPYMRSIKLNNAKFQNNSNLNFGVCFFIFLFIVIAGFYIYFHNLNVEFSYKIEKFSKMLKQLDDENKLLNIELSGASRLENLKMKAQILNLVEVKSAKFLEISNKQLVENEKY